MTQDNDWWFEGCRQHQLLIQRCTSCGRLHHPPGPACPACRSFESDRLVASGRGVIYSFIVNHAPQAAAFDYPLPIGLIELEEGTRLVANLIGFDLDDIRIGAPVQLEFIDGGEGLVLPAFRPVPPGGERMLPPISIPITRTMVVSTAIASRDYQDVHHDSVLARKRGSKDIFTNILTTNGLIGRFLTEWAGPDARIKKISIRLGVPNYPDDTLRITGHVASEEDGTAEISLRGTNSLGDHVTGTAWVQVA